MNTVKKNALGYNYKYTDLSEIHRWLESNNLSYYQYIETVDGNDYIMTVPVKDGKAGEPRRGCRVVQAELKGNSNPAQEQGSAITYARRYSMLMAFGLCTADSDAEDLSQRDDMNKPITKAQIRTLESKAADAGLEFNPQAYGRDRMEDLTRGEYGRALNDLATFTNTK